jgi:hypothetical protein
VERLLQPNLPNQTMSQLYCLSTQANVPRNGCVASSLQLNGDNTDEHWSMAIAKMLLLMLVTAADRLIIQRDACKSALSSGTWARSIENQEHDIMHQRAGAVKSW